MGFVHDGLGFLVGEIDHAVQHAVGFEVIAAIGVILDPVGTVHDLLADRFAHAVHAVSVLDTLRDDDFPRVAERAVHAGRSQGARRDLHARAWYFSVIDGFFDVHL